MENNREPRKTITVERVSITTIRTRGQVQRFYCNVCGEEVNPLPLAGEILRLIGEPIHDLSDTVIETDEQETNA